MARSFDQTFDMATAQSMADAFSFSTGIGCRVLSEQGDVLYKVGIENNECDYLRSLPGNSPSCSNLHCQSLQSAERFGGRYIYSCASGLTFFSSPILSGGIIAGGLVAGPVLISDVDDCLDDIIEKRDLPASAVRSLQKFLHTIPQVTPSTLRHLSVQLFSNAVYIGDSSRTFFLEQTQTDQQRTISEYVHQVKASSQDISYPMDKEQALTAAIAQGDKQSAAALLNDLLGHVFFFTKDPDTIQTRITELLVVLSRAAISGGGNTDIVFDINYRYMQELRKLRTQEEVAQWLAKVLNRYTSLVFDLVDSKHKNIIRKAVDYINLYYARDLTLSEVANYVGYSHSHFSKVFKEEMAISFRTYLNQVRVEKSKYFLLSGMSTISEICDLCGFDDQSYYCKVFKKVVGTTPDRFRKQMRRIDEKREYGN